MHPFSQIAVPPSAFLFFLTFFTVAGRVQTAEIRNLSGIEMKIDSANKDPTLSVTVPDGSPDDHSFKILLPEHVTVRPDGQIEVQHLYIYYSDLQGHLAGRSAESVGTS